MKVTHVLNYKMVSTEYIITVCQSIQNVNTLIKFDAIKVKVIVNIILPA